VTAADLLAGLTRQGFTFAPEGDGIRVTPASRLTEADRQAIRANKAELLAMLVSVPTAATPPLARPRPVYLPCCCPSEVCWRCCNRPCEVCGRPTGSAFIRQCVLCGGLPDSA
jgi:hypothetical protein